MLSSSQDVKVLGYQTPVTGMMVLGLVGGLEILRAWKGTSLVVDHAGHLAGMAAGVAAAWYVRREAAQRETTRKEYTPEPAKENC